jgi:hypothetical protein
MIWYHIVLIVGVLALLLAFTKVIPIGNKKMFIGLGVVALLIGAVPATGIFDNVSLKGFDVAGTDADEDINLIITTTSTSGEKTITTLTGTLFEDLSNSPTTIDGQVRAYEEGANLKDSTVQAVKTLEVVDGVVTGSNVLCNHNYQFVYYDNGSAKTWYNHEFGTFAIDCGSTTDSTITTKTWTPNAKISALANLDDLLDETTATGGYINGNSTNITDPKAEVSCAGTADAVIVYNETTGDGSWYIIPQISASGGDKKLKDAVLCFEWESGASPEGNEFSSIYTQSESGASYSGMPSNLVTLFNTESCAQLGDIVGGTSGRYKIIFTVTESNLDTSDDFKIILDDLGDNAGKETLFSAGATQDAIDIDAYN